MWKVGFASFSPVPWVIFVCVFFLGRSFCGWEAHTRPYGCLRRGDFYCYGVIFIDSGLQVGPRGAHLAQGGLWGLERGLEAWNEGLEAWNRAWRPGTEAWRLARRPGGLARRPRGRGGRPRRSRRTVLLRIFWDRGPGPKKATLCCVCKRSGKWQTV